MPKWLNNLIIVAGGIATAFSLLQFFGIDAAFLWKESQSMSGRFVFLLISLTLLLVGLYLKIRRSYITPANVRSRIREWLDAFGYSYQVVPWETWHWGFGVTTQNLLVFVARTKGHSDHLVFTTTIAPMTTEQRETFNALSEAEKEKFYRQLALETAKAKIRFFSDASLSEVRIDKGIPITSKLAAADVIDAISEIYFSATIIWNTIAFHLGGRPEEVRLLEPSFAGEDFQDWPEGPVTPESVRKVYRERRLNKGSSEIGKDTKDK
jgi:hypothetical protein